jgi:NADH:ubiquinone oxidoreductase subunit F (NADH-binding)
LMIKINEGKGSFNDLSLLEKLGRVMSYSCLCGLGQAVPTPVLTTIDQFKTDYCAKFV